MRRSFIVGLVALLVAAACGGSGVGTSAPTAASVPAPGSNGSITFLDTAGGANFQKFFGQLLPEAEKELGIKISYLPGSGADLLTRLKAQSAGQGDVGVALLKPDVLGNMLDAKIPFTTLTDAKAEIPNLSLIDPTDLREAFGVATTGRATPFWRDQFGIIYDSAKIANPPTSWADFYARRAEWRGHIGMIRPDAGSGGGRLMMRDFLIGAGVDFSKTFPEPLQSSPEWTAGLAKFKDFSSNFYQPLAGEPNTLFQQFKQGDVWITEYAIDFTLWSADQGLLQQTVKASVFPSGMYGGAAYLAAPANASPEQKKSANALINWLLSEKTQLRMLTQMYQYMAINKFDGVPAQINDRIPAWDVVKGRRIPLVNLPSFNWLKENGGTYIGKP